ncbi:MAG: hypothetical protein PHF84_07220 [bacterium]|nr:hypothetical protein [bacterium]
MKLKNVCLLTSLFFFTSCGYYHRSIIVFKDYDQVLQSANSMVQKMDFKSTGKLKDKNNSEINISKFMEGYGTIYIGRKGGTDPTSVTIKFTTGNYDDATWIFEQALIEEIYSKENPQFQLKSNLKRKSLLTYSLLNTVSPFASLPYIFYNNPYYGAFNKYFLTIGYGALDTFFLYNAVNPNLESSNRKVSLIIFISCRIYLYVVGMGDIPYYNHLVDSGYYINNKKLIEESINIPVFFKRL